MSTTLPPGLASVFITFAFLGMAAYFDFKFEAPDSFIGTITQTP